MLSKLLYFRLMTCEIYRLNKILFLSFSAVLNTVDGGKSCWRGLCWQDGLQTAHLLKVTVSLDSFPTQGF